MTAIDLIIQIFCSFDDEMKAMPKHSQAKLYPSELITIGILFALKGDHFRLFYRWLCRDYAHLFARLPERTRLQRLLKTHQDWCEYLLAQPSICSNRNLRLRVASKRDGSKLAGVKTTPTKF